MTYRSRGAIHRWAALGLLVGVIWASFALVINPIFTHYGESVAKIEALSLQANKQAGLIARQSELERSISELKKNKTVAKILPSGASEGVIVATLQEQIEKVVHAVGGRVSSAEPLAEDSAGAYRKLGMHVRLSADHGALRDILYAAEYGDSALQHENLSIRSRSPRAFGVANPLDVQIDFFVYQSKKSE